MNKNMEQREERADFYIINPKTFLKAQRASSQQGCHIPKAIQRMPSELVPTTQTDIYFFWVYV